MATAKNKKLNLKELASSISGGSALMEGREKVNTEDIVGIELTLVDFDILKYEKDGKEVSYPICVFKELPDKFYQGGMQLSRLCEAIASDEDLLAELKEQGLKLMFESSRTRSGNDFVNFSVLD